MARIVLLDDLPIGIDARGQWTHGGEPLHPRVATLFSRNVWPTRAGGYEIVLGMARSPVVVADTAYFVRSARLAHGADGALQGVTLALSDGTEEPLDATTLMQAPDGTFYCRLRRAGMVVPARLAPGDYHALALCCEEADGHFALVLGGRRYPIGHYDAAPRSLSL